MQFVGKILCPIDFSEPSYEGMKIAETLALQYSSELILLHVVTPIPMVSAPPPGISVPVDVEGYQKHVVDEAENKLHLVQTELSIDVRVRMMVEVGIAADQIVKVADSEGVDLIVIATHGHTGWRRFMLGSVTEKVIRNASCFVLSVPSSQE